MSAIEDLRQRLEAFTSAPFLFVGAGVSRRYLKADGWTDLLMRMAAHTPKPYAYYLSKSDGDLPRVATEIAKDFHEIWWADPAFEESRSEWGADLKSSEGPLKVEVARHTSGAMASIPTTGPLAQELDLLRQVVVDGAITTNYDGMLEHLFPDFKVYVGQDELLFSDAQGVGEIYKIHGSDSNPESLVLTAADYGRFSERNPYLAAKLLTIFVEHPVIFLGYSLSDPHITDILLSIARVLTTENLSRLQDRLIFVRWEPSAATPTLVSTQIAVGGFAIPIVLVVVPDFRSVFATLGSLRRKFPAKLLRQLKEQVYDLVLTSDPDERLTVVDIDDTTRTGDIDVVFGVGVQRKLAGRGYVGLTRKDLLLDALADTSELEPTRVVGEALPRVSKGSGNTPIYRYLRGASLLDEDGALIDPRAADPRVNTRVDMKDDPFKVPSGSKTRANRLVREANGEFGKLAESAERGDVLLALLALPRSTLAQEEVRRWLLDARDALDGPHATAWAKAVALYDYVKFGNLTLTQDDLAGGG